MPGAVVALMVAAVVVGSTRPVPPAPPPTASQIAGPSPDATTGAEPVPALAGATDSDALPACVGAAPLRAPSSPPEPPVAGDVALRLVGQLGGTAEGVALDGGRMFVGAGRRVIEVDLADPARPLERSVSQLLPGTVEDIAVRTDVLVVAAGEGGVAILDIATLAVRASLAMPGYAESVTVAGTVAFVADGPGGLRIVDLRRIEQPVEIAFVHDLHRILDVAVADGVAYLAAADEGLLVVAVDDPASPRPIGALFTGGYAYGVAVTGDRVVLADGWGGFRSIDVSLPAGPRALGTLETTTWAMAVAVADDRAYGAVGPDGLWMLDVSGGGAPRRVADLSMPSGHAVGLSADGARVALIDAAGAVRVVDAGGTGLLERSAYAPLSQAYGLAVSNGRAFIAARGQGLRVVDVSDPTKPRDLITYETADLVHGVAAIGTKVLFGTWPRPGSPWVSSLYTLDVARPGLAPITPVAGPSPWMASIAIGEILAVPAELGAYFIDTRPTPPCLLGHLATNVFPVQGFESNGLAVSGDFAYVAPYFKGEAIQVADISDPRAPRLLGPAAARQDVGTLKVLAAGPRLYALEHGADGPAVSMFDLSRPREPAFLGSVRLPSPTATGDESGPHLAYAGGRLFVADSAGGLVVVDVADQHRPRIAGRLRLPGEAVGVVVVGRHAFVASDGGGLFVVEWSDRAGATARGAPRDLRPEGQPALQPAPPCVVDTTADDGPGSLRDCLGGAQDGTVITFDPADFPAERPATIAIRSTLRVTGRVAVDGSGAGVILDGGGEVAEGIHVGDGTVVRGLIVTGFVTGILVDGSGNALLGNVVSANRETGIAIQGPDNRVAGNLVGLDPSGGRSWGTQGVGLFVSGVGNVIGGPAAADRNVIGGNQIELYLKEARGTVVEGNRIGTDASGTVVVRAADATTSIGVWVGSTRNLIARNVISGGVNILDPGSNYNAVIGNLIDMDATGTRSLGSGGVVVSEPFNRVGGTLPGEANVLSGGILIAARDVIVLGNRIGVERDDPVAGDGAIVVERRGSAIGGRWETAANVIFGGLEVRADLTLAIGNRISPRAEDGAVGIRIEQAGNGHFVANVIDGGEIGVELAEGAHDNVVRGNVIRRARIAVVSRPGAEANVVTDNVTGP